GGRGFIGSFLVEDLLQRGLKVRCLLRRSSKGRGWLEGQNIQVCDGDITDASSLTEATTDVDHVFHLAGLTKARTKEEFYRANVEGTRNLLVAAGKNSSDLKRFVLVSSLAAAGPSNTRAPVRETDPVHPVSNYGTSKWMAEEAAHAFAGDLPISIVRPPAVFGPRDSDVLQMFKYIKRGWLPLLSGGQRYISMIYVQDLVSGLYLAATRDQAIGQTYFLAYERGYSWDEFAETVADVLAVRVRRIIMPLLLVHVVSAFGSLYGKLTNRATLFNLDKFKEIKPTHWLCDTTKARKEIGFEPIVDLKTAVTETCEWYQKERWL
ncbi:NAD-dependent epimerase/dehydratase family protein, partial [bacterium]|nr:NAD-dependent epimerase/dehydratase family protein [bacterium]